MKLFGSREESLFHFQQAFALLVRLRELRLFGALRSPAAKVR